MEAAKILPPAYEQTGVISLTEKIPTVTLYEDGQPTKAYCLQTEEDEDFKGKFFHYSVQLGLRGIPPVPIARIDGFIPIHRRSEV